jgi:protein-L-isoaspartate O-methyltransferase
MITSSESASLRRQLVMDLQKQGAIHSQAIAAAFDAIPRELFVPLFFRREEGTWRTSSRDLDEETWLRQIYQDEALVTLLDERGFPISSSSQPSIMATMLEALDVRSGMRVLEIGTGTGYNAALLARLTGDAELVTTIDIDPHLARQAECALHEIVGPLKVLVGNGTLVQGLERMDRIIVTTSVISIPRIWYHLLTVGGRIVMPLRGCLGASGLLTLTRDEGGGSGSFSLVPVAFMPMQEQGEEQRIPSVQELLELPLNASFRVEAEEEEAMITSLSNDHFRWFIQWIWPSRSLSILPMTLSDGRRAFQIKEGQAPAYLQLTCAPSGGWSGQQRGAFPLYQQLMKHYKLFERLGRPEKHAYHVQIVEHQCRLFLQATKERIILSENLFSSSAKLA